MDRESRLQPLARAVLRTQSDHRLVGLTREGRDSAFDEIVRRYRPGLVAFAAAYAPSDSAEDVVQESFTAAWRALQDSDTEIQLKPWLYTIVRNRALNARRDARPHEQLTEQIDGVRQPDEIALGNEELGHAVAAINSLPEPQRRALVRSALDGHTHDQIAAELGSSPGAVGQLVFRARAALRTGLGVLIPLPIVRLLLEPAGPAAAGATGAGAVAAAAGGGSLVAKGAVVALIGVAAAGSGIAIDHASKSDAKDEAVPVREAGDDSSLQSHAANAPTTVSSGAAIEPGDDHAGGPGPSDGHRGEGEPGDDHRGGDSSSGSGDGSGSSSGPSASSGPGSSGSSGDSSGPGGGERTTTTTTTTSTSTTEIEDEFEDGGSSGPGDGGSSGSGGSSGPG